MKLLKAKEVAEIVGLGRTKVYQLIASGEIPSITIGRSVRVPVDGLKAWIVSKASGPEGGGVPV